MAKAATATAPNFDRLAIAYRWMEFASFGPWLQWCRCAFLSELRGCGHALVLGDGDGRFTAQLFRSNSNVRIDAVDASRAMLRSLVRRAGTNAFRVRTEQADARKWCPAAIGSAADGNGCGPYDLGPYDLVATHFFLDCLTTGEVADLAKRVCAAMHPSALWIVSDFAIPSGRLGWAAAKIVGGLYKAFRIMTGLRVQQLPDHHAALQDAGLRCARTRSFLGGVLVAEVWKLAL